MEKFEKSLFVCICIAVCVQRLSMAIGSIFWGISIALSLYLFYVQYKNNVTIKKGVILYIHISIYSFSPSLKLLEKYKEGNVHIAKIAKAL